MPGAEDVPPSFSAAGTCSVLPADMNGLQSMKFPVSRFTVPVRVLTGDGFRDLAARRGPRSILGITQQPENPLQGMVQLSARLRSSPSGSGLGTQRPVRSRGLHPRDPTASVETRSPASPSLPWLFRGEHARLAGLGVTCIRFVAIGEPPMKV